MDLVAPVKRLHEAKTRLRGAADRGAGADAANARLTVMMEVSPAAVVLTPPTD